MIQFLTQFILAHIHTGRDTTSQYQELTVDLRRLRNLLEDVEEHVAEDASLDISSHQISTPIMQCKAILCGLDLNLKPFQCSTEELKQNVQPEAVLALKASVQVATHSLFVSFEALVGTGRLNDSEASGLPSTSIVPQSPQPVVSTDGLSTATNVTLRVRNSARIISLSGGRPVGVAADGLYRPSLEENDHEPNQLPFRSRRALTAPPMPADWHSPFSVPDPLAYDTSRACTMLTDYRVRPKTTVPKIFVSKCDTPDNALPVLADAAGGLSSLETKSPALEHWTTHAPKRRYSEDSSRNSHESEASAGAACTMYVPYRPWYEPIKKMDNHLDMHSVQEHSDSQHEVDSTSTKNATSSSSTTTEQNGENERSSPPMPVRSPPLPPLSQIVRSKRKPPVPPRRRRQSCPTKETSHTPASLIARTGARIVEESVSGLVKLPYLDELKHVLKGKPLSRPRASTEERHLVTENNQPTSLRHSSIFRARSMEVIAKQREHRVEMRRTRSASAPELTTPQLRLPIFSHLFELPAESTKTPVDHKDNVHAEISETEHTRLNPESIDPSLMLTRMDHICGSWNNRYYSKAESYLTRHLTMVQHDHEIARKVCHLLGVCASYRGHWQRALLCFISVINKPVREPNQLDSGDKAAFYWLGDTYAILNRNEEALLAYCLAGPCDASASASFSPSSGRCLRVYQERLRQTVSKSSFRDVWADASFHSGPAPRGSIVHCTVVTHPAAQMSLQSHGLTSSQCNLHSTNKNSPEQSHDHMPVSDLLLIAPSHLESTSCWPMPHDPTFNFQGVLEGSLIAKHIDIMNAVLHNPESLYFSRCFSPNLSTSHCVDLRRLITAARESLQTLAMRWHEIVSRNGVFFLVQYDSVDGHIATMDYFRIEVTRFSLRNGFGLNFCSENTNRARRTSTYYHSNGILDGATKRELKRCLRAAIETACSRQQAPAGPKSTGSLRSLPASLLRLPRVVTAAAALSSSSASVPTPAPPRESTESSMSPAELETTQTTPQSSIDLSTLVPPIGPGTPLRARDRISVRSSYNERHLLGPLVR
jgi:hypothetical protein